MFTLMHYVWVVDEVKSNANENFAKATRLILARMGINATVWNGRRLRLHRRLFYGYPQRVGLAEC